jgi:hypothetical protein
MKKIIVFLSLTVPFTFMACSNDKTEAKKEVIVVPAAPATTPPEKNTSIVLDKNGVKVATKKVDVVVNPQKK